MDFIVTTTRNNQEELRPVAKRWSNALQMPFICREDWNLDHMLDEYEVKAALLASVKGAKVYCNGHKFAYHPSMAKLRIENIKRGGTDHLVEIMGLKPGMRILDCTLGLAADAVVASYAVGATGKVVGLEKETLLHFAVQQGLKNYEANDEDLVAAMRRIVAINADAETFLKTRTEEYDVVYFDPMFGTPVRKSSNMEPLRDLACNKPLTRELVDLALTRAPMVVVKERYTKYLRGLGCTDFGGGKYSSVKYGIRYR